LIIDWPSIWASDVLAAGEHFGEGREITAAMEKRNRSL